MEGVIQHPGIAEALHEYPVGVAVRVEAVLLDLEEDAEGEVRAAESAGEGLDEEVEGVEADADVGA